MKVVLVVMSLARLCWLDISELCSSIIAQRMSLGTALASNPLTLAFESRSGMGFLSTPPGLGVLGCPAKVQVAWTAIGLKIINKEIKTKSCNGKIHFTKPYPLNNLYRIPNFVEIGSWHDLPYLCLTLFYSRSFCSFMCIYRHVKICIRTAEQLWLMDNHQLNKPLGVLTL